MCIVAGDQRDISLRNITQTLIFVCDSVSLLSIRQGQGGQVGTRTFHSHMHASPLALPLFILVIPSLLWSLFFPRFLSLSSLSFALIIISVPFILVSSLSHLLPLPLILISVPCCLYFSQVSCLRSWLPSLLSTLPFSLSHFLFSVSPFIFCPSPFLVLQTSLNTCLHVALQSSGRRLSRNSQFCHSRLSLKLCNKVFLSQFSFSLVLYFALLPYFSPFSLFDHVFSSLPLSLL